MSKSAGNFEDSEGARKRVVASAYGRSRMNLGGVGTARDKRESVVYRQPGRGVKGTP